jgi:hypothetical protein
VPDPPIERRRSVDEAGGGDFGALKCAPGVHFMKPFRP